MKYLSIAFLVFLAACAKKDDVSLDTTRADTVKVDSVKVVDSTVSKTP